MLEAIRSAERTINFATYVYWTGSIAPEFAEALAERAEAGVEVNVLLDAVGAAKMDRALIDRLEDAGAKVAWFRPPKWYTLHKLNNRTHRKILVVDGRVGFTGGVGIAEEWTGNCEDPGHWRDTHVRVEGPAARDLFGGFLDNWAEATQCILSGPDHLPDIDGFDDGVQVQVTRSTAEKGSTDAEHLFYAAIACAQERIWLTTAYFAPRRAFVEALCEAVGRGVDVRVLTNGPHIDKQVVRQAGHRTYERMLECGSRIFEYQRTMLHAKVMIVDANWATVGVDQLRQPLVRPQRRAQPVAARPGDRGRAGEALPGRPGRRPRARPGRLAVPPGPPAGGQGAGQRRRPPGAVAGARPRHHPGPGGRPARRRPGRRRRPGGRAAAAGGHGAAEHAGEELFRARAARFLRRRLDPEAATGLALTVALGLVFAAALGFGLVADMVTSETGPLPPRRQRRRLGGRERHPGLDLVPGRWSPGWARPSPCSPSRSPWGAGVAAPAAAWPCSPSWSRWWSART